MYKILIIEDDETIARSIEKYLQQWNFEIKIIEKFDTVIDNFVAFNPNLVLLDINLPYYNGYYYCEEIRKISKTPIIFISSENDDMNIVMAVNTGADDYIVKPFKLVLLKAKIDAILRRVYSFNNENNLITYKDLIYDSKKDKITYRGNSLELTNNESKILQILLEHRENIVSRDEIMRQLWQNENFVDENTLSVNVNRLRKKLEQLGIKDYIVTKKGKGYLV